MVAVGVAPHAQHPGQLLQEEDAHPRRHGVVGGRRAVVHVDHEHGDDDRERDEDHDEEQVLADERDDLGRRGDDLLDDQQEDGERHQHRGGQRQLLALVRRQVEHQHREEGQAQAGDDEEERVEERQPLQDEGVGDERVGVHAVPAAAVDAGGVEDLPLAVVEEVPAVHLRVHEHQVHHVAVVGPRAELHGAVLPVEGEEGDVHGAGRLVAGGRRPRDGAVVSDDDFGHEGALKAAVGAGWRVRRKASKKMYSAHNLNKIEESEDGHHTNVYALKI